MDQIVKKPIAARPASIETALGLDPESMRKTRGRRLRFRLLAAFVILACAAAAWYWLTRPTGESIFTTVAAERGDITVQITATGTLQPLTQVDVSSELSGVVRIVGVDENERVTRGQVLAELDTLRLAAQVERAEAGVIAAQARIRDAETTLNEMEQTLARSANLQARGMVADQALETATATRDRAESSVASAEADLAIANAELKLQQAELSKAVIVAPIDGIVLTRAVNPGQTVAASTSAPVLFVIAENLETMQLEAAVDEADIGAVAKGQQARFTVDAFPERQFDAEISDIAFASVATEGVVTYEAKLAVDNSELLLRPGMTATVEVVTRQADGVVTVPNAAFRYRPPPAAEENRGGFSLQSLFSPRFSRRGGGRGNRGAGPAADGAREIYVLENGAPEPVRIQVGASDGDRTEIVSGLEAGAEVITGASEPRG